MHACDGLQIQYLCECMKPMAPEKVGDGIREWGGITTTGGGAWLFTWTRSWGTLTWHGVSWSDLEAGQGGIVLSKIL